MAVVMARARVTGGHGAVADLQDAVEAGEVGRIVRRHHDGEGVALLEEEAFDDLAARGVERGVRFVEQQDFGALHERAGEERALQLAAGERVDRAVGELRQAELREGPVDGVVAMTAFLEPAVVRVRAHLHEPADEQREAFGQLRTLGEVGDAAAAKRFGVAKRTAQSWRLGERTPRPEQAAVIVKKSPVTFEGIYRRQAA